MSDSFISVRCPRCNALASVKADQEGETIKCRRCEQEMLVPGQRKNPGSDSVDSLINLDDDLLSPIAKLAPADAGENAFVGNDRDSEPDPEKTDSGNKPPQHEDGLPELTDWSNYRRTNPKSDETEMPAGDSSNTGASETTNAESGDDELDDLLITVTQSAAEPEPAEGKDPFEVDRFAALKIDGITPTDSEFPVTCNVCGSLMYARISQVGTKLKCHDCYSMITIHAPRKVPDDKGKPKKEEAPRHEYEENEGYRLEPESKLAPIDTTIDISLGEIDYDDNDFFAKRRDQESAEPEIFDDSVSDAAVESKPEHTNSAADGVFDDEPDNPDDGDEYGLAPVQDDVMPPKSIPTVFESMDDLLAEYPAPRSRPVTNESKLAETERPISVVPIEDTDDPDEATVVRSPEKGREDKKESKQKIDKTAKKKSDSGGTEDITSPFSGLGKWIASAFSVVVQPANLGRIAMGAVALGFGNWLLFTGLSYFDPEENTEAIKMFWGAFVMGVGGIPTMLTYFFLAVHSNSIIRDGIEQRSSAGEWPDFSIADFIGQVIYVGTSFWLAAIPGLIVGEILWIVTDFGYFLPGCILASSVLFVPFFLSSVVFNDSPIALVSGDAFVSISRFRNRWIRYWIVSFLIAILFVGGLAGASLGPIFGFLFPVMQLALVIALFWMVGDLTGYIVRFMEQKAEA